MAKRRAAIRAETARAYSGRKSVSGSKISAKAVPMSVQPQHSRHLKNVSQIKDISEIKSTADVQTSDALIDQVIGQDKAIEVIKKAAVQKRNVLLVGTPGTGKSMLAQAMAELMPIQELEDVLVVANRDDDNMPKVRTVKAGEGRKIVSSERMQSKMTSGNSNLMMMGFMFLSIMIGLYILPKYFDHVIVAALLIGSMLMGAAMIFAMQLGRGRVFENVESMKLIVDNAGKKKAPFVDATGSRAGSLLGDVKHDPFQSFDGRTEIQLNGESKSLEVAFRQLAKEYQIERRQGGYEAILVPKRSKLRVTAVKNGKIRKAKLLFINRRPYAGNIVNLKAGKRSLKTTPEHAFISPRFDKQAKKLRKGMTVYVAA